MIKNIRVGAWSDSLFTLELLTGSLTSYPDIDIVQKIYGAPANIDWRSDACPEVLLLFSRKDWLCEVIQHVSCHEQVEKLGIVLVASSRQSSRLLQLRRQCPDHWIRLTTDKIASVTVLANAIRQAARGEHNWPAIPRLSHRQTQILSLIGQGLSNRAIAERIHIREKTVENQVNLLYHALEIPVHDPTVNARVLASQLANLRQTPSEHWNPRARVNELSDSSAD